jgi:3-hydroxyisobutyrate dehydrogenase
VYDAVCNEGEGEWASKDFRYDKQRRACCMVLTRVFSVVYEWIRKKQDEGVERGWKDGNPVI